MVGRQSSTGFAATTQKGMREAPGTPGTPLDGRKTINTASFSRRSQQKEFTFGLLTPCCPLTCDFKPAMARTTCRKIAMTILRS